MESANTERTETPTFRRAWWGYDRAEVEEFLRQTALDRQRHQESLAWLDALMSGYDPQAREAAIAAKRRESHEARIAALRRNAEGLARTEAGSSWAQSVVPMALAAWASVRSLPRLDAYAILICALFGMSLLAMRDSSSGTAEVRATPAPVVSQETAQFKVVSTSSQSPLPRRRSRPLMASF